MGCRSTGTTGRAGSWAPTTASSLGLLGKDASAAPRGPACRQRRARAVPGLPEADVLAADKSYLDTVISINGSVLYVLVLEAH